MLSLLFKQALLMSYWIFVINLFVECLNVTDH